MKYAKQMLEDSFWPEVTCSHYKNQSEPIDWVGGTSVPCIHVAYIWKDNHTFFNMLRYSKCFDAQYCKHLERHHVWQDAMLPQTVPD